MHAASLKFPSFFKLKMNCSVNYFKESYRSILKKVFFLNRKNYIINESDKFVMFVCYSYTGKFRDDAVSEN